MGNLGVAAANGDVQFSGSSVDGRKRSFRNLTVVGNVGKQNGRHKKAGLRTHGSDVVGVDMNGIPADLVAGESDGIGFCHQQSVAEFDDCGVLTECGRDQQALMSMGVGGE